MMPIPKHLMLLLFLCLAGSSTLKGQQKDLYAYQDLSAFYYKKQQDSLKKAWTCPALYKEKATQKQFKEIWDGRTTFFTSAIEDNNYVYDKEICKYLDEVVSQIQEANKEYLPVKPFVVLDRSASVNAYAIGSNVLAINLGLLAFAKSREEIALTIAHELSHNILQHPENGMKKRAEWLTSAEYKESMQQVLESDYGRLTRLKKVFENYSFSRNRHQRYHEGDADSMAIILLKNSHISFAPEFFLRMDSADVQYLQPLQQPLKTYFAVYNIAIEDIWTKKRSKGLSTRDYDFHNNNSMADSLKTHPDCVVRYNNTVGRRPADAVSTAIPENISRKVNRMLIWNMYCNKDLTPCLYRILQEKDRGNTDAWYDFMFNNVLLSLYKADKDLLRFSTIGVQRKEYISKEYYQLQTMLEQMPRDKLAESCKGLQNAAFWSNVSNSEKAMQRFLKSLVLSDASMDPQIAKQFMESNKTSMYCEYVHPFEKK
jgi:predicted SprT family Zn-dependent metalloprotease